MPGDQFAAKYPDQGDKISDFVTRLIPFGHEAHQLDQQLKQNPKYKEVAGKAAAQVDPFIAGMAQPGELGGPGGNLARGVIEKAGLVYKGELTKGSGVHMFEHPNHPGVTAAMNAEEINPASVREHMDVKLKDSNLGKIEGSINHGQPTGKPELDQAIRAGGGLPGGVQRGLPDKGISDLVMFHDPQTGTTLALPAEQITAENVTKRLTESRAEFAAKAKPEATHVYNPATKKIEPMAAKQPPIKSIGQFEPGDMGYMRPDGTHVAQLKGEKSQLTHEELAGQNKEDLNKILDEGGVRYRIDSHAVKTRLTPEERAQGARPAVGIVQIVGLSDKAITNAKNVIGKMPTDDIIFESYPEKGGQPVSFSGTPKEVEAQINRHVRANRGERYELGEVEPEIGKSQAEVSVKQATPVKEKDILGEGNAKIIYPDGKIESGNTHGELLGLSEEEVLDLDPDSTSYNDEIDKMLKKSKGISVRAGPDDTDIYVRVPRKLTSEQMQGIAQIYKEAKENYSGPYQIVADFPKTKTNAFKSFGDFQRKHDEVFSATPPARRPSAAAEKLSGKRRVPKPE
jgi:hypothetical protein